MSHMVCLTPLKSAIMSDHFSFSNIALQGIRSVKQTWMTLWVLQVAKLSRLSTTINNLLFSPRTACFRLHHTVQKIFTDVPLHEWCVLFLYIFTIAEEHPAKKCQASYRLEPNIQAAVVTQRGRTCSDALRPGLEKIIQRSGGCKDSFCTHNGPSLFLTDKKQHTSMVKILTLVCANNNSKLVQ